MQSLTLIALACTVNWGTVWAAVAAIAAVVGIGIAVFTVRVARRQLLDAREQNLASRVDALLTMLSTGDIARARSSLYRSFPPAGSTPSGQAGSSPQKLGLSKRDQVFELLWALQRVSVLTPVISASGAPSIRALSAQITQIVATLTRLGQKVDRTDKGSMAHAVSVTEESLADLEAALRAINSSPEESWSDALHKYLCTTPRIGKNQDAASGQVQTAGGVVEQRPEPGAGVEVGAPAPGGDD